MGQIYEGDDFITVPKGMTTNPLSHVRKEIIEFALEMEKEMLKKDEIYKSTDGIEYSIQFLINKLKEERKEVDFEINTCIKKDKILSFEINTELVHEAISCMLLRNKIKEENKNLIG